MTSLTHPLHVLSLIPEKYPRLLPKAVLFDWDNTLVDTLNVAQESLNEALVGVGRNPMTPEEFAQSPHLSMRDAGPTLFGEHAERGERLFYEAVQRLHLDELLAFEGVETLLTYLTDRGIHIGVVSNKDGQVLRKEVRHLGWEDHFKHVIGSRDTSADKPSHIPVVAALEKSTILPSHDVWFVGDSMIDVLCAKASGCIPFVVGHGEASLEEDIVHAKDFANLAQILSHL
jgi:phosphoglycolate phosphatase